MTDQVQPRSRHWTVHPVLILVMVLLLPLGYFWAALLLFGLVLLHELAHAAVAWLYGLHLERVELLPFGGRSTVPGLEWAGPGVEARVAAAGPLANLALAAVAQLAWMQNRLPLELLSQWERLNLSLALINCLPVLPLDGGWLARAVLAGRWGWVAATQRLAHWGEQAGLLFLVAGTMQWAWRNQGLNWLVFGLFLWLSARRESYEAAQRYQQQLLRRFAGLPGNLPLAAHWLVVGAEQPLYQVVTRLVPHQYHLVAVLDHEGRLRRCVSETELWQQAGRWGSVVPVGEAVGGSRPVDGKRLHSVEPVRKGKRWMAVGTIPRYR